MYYYLAIFLCSKISSWELLTYELILNGNIL